MAQDVSVTKDTQLIIVSQIMHYTPQLPV